MSKDVEKSVWFNFLAGAMAGIIGDMCVHPIDTIKTRLQARRKQLYKGLIDGFRKILLHEGVGAFYQGFGTVATMTIPAHALYFGGYEVTKSVLQPSRSDGDKSLWVYFISGIVADVCGSIMWVPMDVLKQRLQMQNNCEMKVQKTRLLLCSIVKNEGFRGLYRGAVAGLATYAPYVGMYFVFYEQWKTGVSKWNQKPRNEIGVIASLTGGFLCGAASAAITCPLDVIKTNIQVYTTREGGYKNMKTAVRGLYNQYGWNAFSRGLVARVMWIAPGTAITIAAYEQCKKLDRKICSITKFSTKTKE
ncbi:mitochondrial substrate carrier family protein E-like [Schistocerca gregaria]|uniref:mitochondrial substrate carrier family protein E-like n=1 Tax=Schistocerca gregaria TaxID=7010 RepID=UPI00211E557D|nr:mitochondrial substrate carrier family protein E-like [Schistocerca gregaria]